MSLEPLAGTPVRFPPGRVAVRLDERYHIPYRRLYRRYQTQIAELPVLRDRDFDGRAVKMTVEQLDALNRALAGIGALNGHAASPFDLQEQGRTQLFKRNQFLS
jgi:hypothetical protein